MDVLVGLPLLTAPPQRLGQIPVRLPLQRSQAAKLCRLERLAEERLASSTALEAANASETPEMASYQADA